MKVHRWTCFSFDMLICSPLNGNNNNNLHPFRLKKKKVFFLLTNTNKASDSCSRDLPVSQWPKLLNQVVFTKFLLLFCFRDRDFFAVFSRTSQLFRPRSASLRGSALNHRPGCVSRAGQGGTGSTLPAEFCLMAVTDQPQPHASPTHLPVASVCCFAEV